MEKFSFIPLLQFLAIPSWFFFIKNRTLSDWLFFIALMAFVVVPGFYITYFAPMGAFYQLREDSVQSVLWMFLVFDAGYLAGRSLIRVPHIRPIRLNLSGSVARLAIILCVCSLLAQIYLISIDRFIIREDLFLDVDAQIPLLIRLVQNAHILGFLLLAILYFRTTDDRAQSHPVPLELKDRNIFIAVTVYTVLVPALQGRRAGVVIPILVLMWMIGIHRRRVLRPLLLLAATAGLLFTATTLARFTKSEIETTASEALEMSGTPGGLAVDAMVGRVGNPFIIATHIAEYASTNGTLFAPHTLQRIGLFLIPIGRENPYSVGNDFGRELGLLSPNNYNVQINMGWVGEAFLDAGWIGLAVYGLVFGMLIHLFGRLFDSECDFSLCGKLFLMIFVINGFQMEISYPIYTFFRAIFALWLLSYVFGISSLPGGQIVNEC